MLQRLDYVFNHRKPLLQMDVVYQCDHFAINPFEVGKAYSLRNDMAV